jgi:acyl-CoA synthetase (AMP-forming)/AMP-acid ligase II
MYYEESFDASNWAARAGTFEPTIYFGVPAMLALILDTAGEASLTAVRSLTDIMFGGSSMPRPLADRLLTTFPGVRLWNLYGLTEAGPGGTALRPEDALRKLSTVGTPLPGMEVRVTDDAHDAVPGGTPGEIAIRTPTRMTAYLDDPEATARTIDDEGWLYTGDIGAMDDDGFLTIMDRKNDMIVRGGFNIYPAEVEQALLQHPAVLEAAVVGKPHRILGEDVMGFVVLRDGEDVAAEALSAFCREHIADYKSPRAFTFLEQLPRNAMGKVLRRELRPTGEEAT